MKEDRAFEIFKVFLAQTRTDWDFRPLALRACDAAEVFHQTVRERYPETVSQTEIKPPQQGPGVAHVWGT